MRYATIAAAVIALTPIAAGAGEPICPPPVKSWSEIVRKQPATSIFTELSRAQVLSVARGSGPNSLSDRTANRVRGGYLGVPGPGSPMAWVFYFDDAECVVAISRGPTATIARLLQMGTDA